MWRINLVISSWTSFNLVVAMHYHNYSVDDFVENELALTVDTVARWCSVNSAFHRSGVGNRVPIYWLGLRRVGVSRATAGPEKPLKRGPYHDRHNLIPYAPRSRCQTSRGERYPLTIQVRVSRKWIIWRKNPRGTAFSVCMNYGGSQSKHHGARENSPWASTGRKAGVFTCVGCQVTLCDPIWQVTPVAVRWDYPLTAIRSFTFFTLEQFSISSSWIHCMLVVAACIGIGDGDRWGGGQLIDNAQYIFITQYNVRKLCTQCSNTLCTRQNELILVYNAFVYCKHFYNIISILYTSMSCAATLLTGNAKYVESWQIKHTMFF